MKKDHKLSYDTMRKQQSRASWKAILEARKNGLSVEEIRKAHLNPFTKKPYTREHLYVIFRLSGE